MFQGDQGRDALIVANIFKAGDPVFIGPVTSIGNMYLGPFYYYFMLPFLFLSYPSPVGPAVGVALVNIMTVALTYILGKQMVGKRTAMIAAFLLATSSVAVAYSRFSWNPNIAPFFGLMMAWCSYKALKKSPWYWLGVALSFSLIIQLHYIALLSGAAAGLVWLWQLRSLLLAKKQVKQLKTFVLATLSSIGIFIVSLTPLILFDFKHQFVNSTSLIKLFTQEKAFTNERATILEGLWFQITLLFDRLQLVLVEQFWFNDARAAMLGLGLILLLLGWLIYREWHSKRDFTALGILLTYLLVGLAGMSLYQENVYVHYFSYLFPVLALLFGLSISQLSREKVTQPLALLILGGYVLLNLPRMPLQNPSWTISDVDRVSDFIISKLGPSEPYNVVLLGPSKDLFAQNYRYYLSTKPNPPLPLERAGEAAALVVINEERINDVAGSPIYEIVVFPDKSSPEVYTIPNGPEIVIFRKK